MAFALSISSLSLQIVDSKNCSWATVNCYTGGREASPEKKASTGTHLGFHTNNIHRSVKVNFVVTLGILIVSNNNSLNIIKKYNNTDNGDWLITNS